MLSILLRESPTILFKLGFLIFLNGSSDARIDDWFKDNFCLFRLDCTDPSLLKSFILWVSTLAIDKDGTRFYLCKFFYFFIIYWVMFFLKFDLFEIESLSSDD